MENMKVILPAAVIEFKIVSNQLLRKFLAS